MWESTGTMIVFTVKIRPFFRKRADLLYIQNFLPFNRKGRTFSSRLFRSISISSRVVSRLRDTLNAPSMTSLGRFMADSTWLRWP